MKRNKAKEPIKVGDPNAKAMWSRCRSQTFCDKTKYNRKHQNHAASAGFLDVQ